jgi:hypothetical protein
MKIKSFATKNLKSQSCSVRKRALARPSISFDRMMCDQKRNVFEKVSHNKTGNRDGQTNYVSLVMPSYKYRNGNHLASNRQLL